MTKPKPVHLGDLVAYYVRGPSPEGAIYWRAHRVAAGVRTLVWTGWATPEALPGELVRALAPAAPEPSALPAACLASGVRTVRDLMETWIPDLRRRELAPRSVARYRDGARSIVAELGATRIPDLTRAHVEDMVGRLRAAGYAPASIKFVLVCLRSAWAWATEEGHIPQRAIRWPLVKVRHVERVTPDAAEALRVIDALPAWLASALRIQWTTGARIGEVLSLRVCDVEPSAAAVVMDGKTGPRRVPIHSRARPHLLALVADRIGDQPVILDQPERGAVSRAANLLRETCDALGVRRWTTHALRRHAVDAMLDAGADIDAAAKILGHTPETMLKHYRKTSDAQRAATVERSLAPLPFEVKR